MLSDIKHVVLNESPRIILFPGFASKEEVEKLISMSDGHYRAMTVVDHETGNSILQESRVGELYCVDKVEPISEALLGRLADVTETRLCQIEGLQVLKYGVSGYYLPHTDWFDPNNKGTGKILRKGGQRILSMVLGLKDADEGGKLVFPKLGKGILIKSGDCVVFENLRNGAPDNRAVHSSLPVMKGEKISCVAWIRQRAYVGSEESTPLYPARAYPETSPVERAAQCADDLEDFFRHYGCYLRIIPTPYIDEFGAIQVNVETKIEVTPNGR